MIINAEDFFKMLSDSTRLRCLMLMQTEGELCVCELTHTLEMSQPKISRHLAHLRESGLLVARREGTWMYYRVNPRLDPWAKRVLTDTLDGVAGMDIYTADRKKLLTMADRPSNACCA